MIKPLADRVVIEPQQKEEKTASGIVLPDNAQEKPMQGIVQAVGPGRWEDGKRVPPSLHTGDLVLYSKYAGTEVKWQGKDVLIMRESDVLGILEPSKEKELVPNG